MSHPNADRVAAAARQRGLDVEIREFPEGTRTAVDAAAAIGVEVGQIVKSLVFQVDDEVVVALVSGPNRLDEVRLATAAGGSEVGKVGADAVRSATKMLKGCDRLWAVQWSSNGDSGRIGAMFLTREEAQAEMDKQPKRDDTQLRVVGLDRDSRWPMSERD